MTLTTHAHARTQVSDFGLTKFNEEVKRSDKGGNVQGSIHWTAPEILNESADVDFILADVYSFGTTACVLVCACVCRVVRVCRACCVCVCVCGVDGCGVMQGSSCGSC
jgi:hypothetical protein